MANKQNRYTVHGRIERESEDACSTIGCCDSEYGQADDVCSISNRTELDVQQYGQENQSERGQNSNFFANVCTLFVLEC